MHFPIKQKPAKVIWLTGLSGAGKTTLAKGFGARLESIGIAWILLDGDEVRKTLCSDLGYSIEDRCENIRRVAREASRLRKEGKTVIAAFISPTIEIRSMAREIIGSENYIEIYLCTPLEVCEKRDRKGLYKKARAGEISNFTGIDSLYEPPLNPLLSIDTSHKTVDKCLDELEKILFD
ncbi:MAG: adenylyl-sulfate kinase [Bacteroidota bacterium]|nr:MAG: adenylyl-sulfate kinase [Bacteroidota bacterium]